MTDLLDRTKLQKREWYERNKERLAEEAKIRYQENPDYYKANAASWREAHPDRKREIDYASQAKNPQITLKSSASYRARKKGAFVEVVDPIMVLESAHGICGICNQQVDPTNFEVDHINPLSLGGEHSYANTQPAHPRCNRRKGNRI